MELLFSVAIFLGFAIRGGSGAVMCVDGYVGREDACMFLPLPTAFSTELISCRGYRQRRHSVIYSAALSAGPQRYIGL